MSQVSPEGAGHREVADCCAYHRELGRLPNREGLLTDFKAPRITLIKDHRKGARVNLKTTPGTNGLETSGSASQTLSDCGCQPGGGLRTGRGRGFLQEGKGNLGLHPRWDRQLQGGGTEEP